MGSESQHCVGRRVGSGGSVSGRSSASSQVVPHLWREVVPKHVVGARAPPPDVGAPDERAASGWRSCATSTWARSLKAQQESQSLSEMKGHEKK